MEVHFTVDIHETDACWDAVLTVYGGDGDPTEPFKTYIDHGWDTQDGAICYVGVMVRKALSEIAEAEGGAS